MKQQKGKIMKKIYILEDLDCANCAAKIENAINELDIVNKASVTFMTKKLVLDADEDKMEQAIQETVKIVKKIEPDVIMKEK
ncbi:heavy-metal-associated domain-containing protein [Lachnotalea glycerini]|jgi:cation transport ATPase|uniref:Heavy-metal-associated domain-containing protein n=2 Tax=Lachnotalea glycerini TaxID=1763509 RepID=A0A318EQ96_9FIRM|nr:cation transporter [Lachnotalea glycerini]PXV89092.1 heavy-metal-associated domain-containing protein [Lachnotalea glycerini]